MEEYAFCNNIFNRNLKSPKGSRPTRIPSSRDSSRKRPSGREGGSYDMRTCLLHCDEQNSFQRAATAFFEKDYNNMLESEKSAPRGAQASCTTIFNTPPNPSNPVTDKNTHARILIAMAIVARTQLISGQS
ncbi:hypothetical protein V6N13_050474 [Hibiscus sabdariffa]